MIWTVLQTIGSLLSGISILTAFILYRFEKRDLFVKGVRQSVADMRATIAEQYSLLESNFIFSYAEEYFSNNYIQHYLSDLGTYIENHLDKTSEEIKDYCRETNPWSPIIEFPILRQNPVQNQYCANNQRITKSIIYDLADIKGLARMLELFQQECLRLEQTISDGIINTDFGIDSICDVLIANRMYINNENILRRKLIQSYIQASSNIHTQQLAKLKAMYKVIEIILKKLFSFNDAELYKYIFSCRKQTWDFHNNPKTEFVNIIKSLPDNLFSSCKQDCCVLMGSIETASKD